MSALVIEAGESAVSLAEARDWLRLGPDCDDAAVAGLIRAATDYCEAFIGQMLIVRDVNEDRDGDGAWQTLARGPLAGIDAMLQLQDGAPPQWLPTAAWETRIGPDGRGAFRMTGGPMRVQIRYRAGLAARAAMVPEALRQGILRLVQHWHFDRDQSDVQLPTMVEALWTPWRRTGLGGGA